MIARGINEDQVGAILKYAVDRMPAVRGVHFQPMSYSADIRKIGKLSRDDSEAPGPDRRADGRHDESRAFHRGKRDESLLYVQANYLRREDGSLSPLAHGESRRGGASEQARKYVEQQWSGAKTGSCCCGRKRTGNTELLLRGEYRTDAAGHFFADEFLVKRHNTRCRLGYAVSGCLQSGSRPSSPLLHPGDRQPLRDGALLRL